MATEYIDKEEACRIIRSYKCGQTSFDDGLDFAISEIAVMPAADVRPVKHGEWIVDDPGEYQLIECDQCHAQMWNHQSELPNYCYECGADMRKAAEIDQVKEEEQ